MANISDFLPHVLPYVEGCSEPMALQHIRDVCIDFCMTTGVWQETLDPISVTKGVRKYDISVPNGSQIHSVTAAWFDRKQVHAISTDSPYMVPEQVAEGFYGEFDGQGTPSTLVFDIQGKTVSLSPAPKEDVASALVIRVVLKPTRLATTIPNVLVNEYEFPIAQGAVARIARVPNKTFTDVNAAMLCEREYLSARSNARVRTNKTFVRSQASIKMRPF